MSDNIKVLINSINKKFGENTLSVASDSKYSDVPRLSSGSLFLDWALGKNQKDNKSGWGMGRFIELYGGESSGKSLIALKTIVEAQKQNFICAYFDCENTLENSYMSRLGVDTSKLIISRENETSAIFNMACDLLKEQAIKIMVFDSIASMIPTIEIEKDLEENQMAAMGRAMSKGLRKLLHFNKNNTLMLFINQLRENPGATYGNPIYTPGGRALKFYASTRVEIRRGDRMEEEDEKKATQGQKKTIIGHVIKFKIEKNKTDMPNREGYFKFLYKTGEIDKIDELVSLAILNSKISRKGAYFAFGKNTFQGREAMEKELMKKPELFQDLKNLVFDSGEVIK